MVYRVYVEKKEALANEAHALLEDLRAFLGIQSLTGLRLFNRYDLEGISREFSDYAVQTVLSTPPAGHGDAKVFSGDTVFAGRTPASMTSGRTPPPSASRSYPKASGPRSAPPGYTSWRAS